MLIGVVVVVGNAAGTYVFWTIVQLAIFTKLTMWLYDVGRSILYPPRTYQSDGHADAQPHTVEELKSWLFKNTHERLPVETQTHTFYQKLYLKHRSGIALASPSAGGFHVGAERTKYDTLTARLNYREHCHICAIGAFAACLCAAGAPPGWTLLRVAPFLADWLSEAMRLLPVSLPFWAAMLLLSPRWILRAAGAGAGCWLAASAARPTARVSMLSMFAWALAGSFAAELHAVTMVRAFSGLLIGALGRVGILLISSPALVPTLKLVCTSAASTASVSRHMHMHASDLSVLHGTSNRNTASPIAATHAFARGRRRTLGLRMVSCAPAAGTCTRHTARKLMPTAVHM